MHFTDDDIKRIKDASANHLVDVVQGLSESSQVLVLVTL